MAVLEDLDPGGLLSDEEQHLEEFDDSNEVLLPPETAETIHTLVEGIITFGQEFCGIELFPYQHDLAYRIIESLLINDGEEITALQSRQCLDGDTVVFRRDGSACRLRDHEDAWSTGVKPTKRYVVRGGGEIVATDNHPVMTDRGWVPAGLLQVGDKVSVMEEWVQWSGVEHVEREVQYGRHLSQHQSVAVKFTEDLLRLLGYMVTDGSNRPGQSLKFTNIRPEYLSEVENLVLSEFGIAAKRYPKGNGADLLFTTSKATGSNPMRLAWQALQWDHKFPLDVFNLPEHLVGEFVNRAWAGDGCVGTKRRRGGRVPEVFLACGNDEVYARYWQALLLKLGVTSTVKREHMGKGTGTFHRLVVSPAGRNIRKFLEVTGEIYGKEEGSRAALAAAPRDRPVAPPTWHCPGVSKHLYRDGYQGAVLEECVRCGSPDPRISTGSYATEPMVHLDGPDGEGFVYRSIVRIEDAGEREVFDVDYGEKGWFVAQGVQVHNSGKTEVLSLVIVSCMVLLPRLAVAYPNLIDQKFKRGFMVGCFAPTDEQSETLHSRVVTYLTSDTAVEMYLDPEIDDEAEGRGKVIKLVKSGSFCRRQTANPRASIESKSYHFIIIDEAQEADDYTVSKSIHPMAAFYNGCLTGDARILMADGTLEELGDLVAKRPAGAQVLALEDEGLQELGLVPRAIERYHDNGVRPTVRVNLRGHRSVTSTLNHRFVKVGNIRRNKWSWARADELAPGDRIAVPWQEYSVGVSEESTLPELLGWVISEGCLTSTSVEVAVSVPHLVEDVGRLVGEYGDDLKWTHNGDRKGRITHAQGRAAGRGGSGAGTGPRPNRLQLELQRLGLWGHGAKTKRIPSECFGWNNDALARLLSRLYAGDGCIHHGSSPVISYSTISEGLKEDLLHALDRFGVYATVTEEPPPADPFPGSLTRRHTSYTVTIADPVSQRRFLDSVGWMKKSNDFDGFVAALDRSCKSRDLPIRFVTVLSVEDAGEQPTYDLQVAGSRNYVANGIISHNTIVKIGTPSRTKGNFYKAVQLNKRRQTRTGMRQNHFEFNWKFCARYNENYNRFIRKEMVRIGQDSDEFMLSYELRWLLSRGMFVTEDLMEDLGNKSMQIVPVWHETPVLVGVDPAKTVDSTVVTVLWVNWDHPDEFGYYESRVLNWLELIGEEWEEQYFQITDFLRNYNVYAIGVDGTGVGDVVADRLARLLPRCEVHALKSSEQEQSKRWKHLQELMNRRRVSWPAHAKTRRLKKWQRFYQQMTDAEKRYRGPSMIVEAPDETDAHDDYVDSLALAVSLTAEMSMPYVMVEDSPFYK